VRHAARITGRSSVLDAAYAVGLSGPGRLHDLIVTLDAVTPGELKGLGRGITLYYGFSERLSAKRCSPPRRVGYVISHS